MTHHPLPEARRAVFGIVCVVLGVSLFAFSDAVIKHLVGAFSPFQILALRGVFAVLITVPFLIRSDIRRAFRVRRPLAHFGRLLIGWIEMTLFIVSLRYVPLAEATALFFAGPLFMTALSGPLLGERVGPKRWCAVVAGFVGVLIVLRPGTDVFNPGATFALASGLGYALMSLATRRLGRTETGASMALTMLVGSAFLSGLVAPVGWVMPGPEEWFALAAIGILGAGGHLAIAEGFRRMPVASVAPFEYSAMIWAVLFGYLFWGELPDAWSWLGTAFIVGSGLYVLHRELRARRHHAAVRRFSASD